MDNPNIINEIAIDRGSVILYGVAKLEKIIYTKEPERTGPIIASVYGDDSIDDGKKDKSFDFNEVLSL